MGKKAIRQKNNCNTKKRSYNKNLVFNFFNFESVAITKLE